MLLTSQASLGDAVRGARKRAGLSQDAVAIQAGMARQSLVALEHGRANPTWDTVLRVAWVVGLVLAATPGELPDPADATPLPPRRVPSSTATTSTAPTASRSQRPPGPPRSQRPQPAEPTSQQVPARLRNEPLPVDLKALLKAYGERA